MRRVNVGWESLVPSDAHLEFEDLSHDEMIAHYEKAGKLAAKILKALNEKAVVGAKLIDLALLADKMIADAGAEPAFPLNISINEEAAHFTPNMDEKRKIRKGDVVKLDVGVQFEGYIADTAFTKALGEGHADLIKATEEATQTVIDVIRPGTNTRDLGQLVEEIIRGYDLNPVKDLSGHSIRRYNLHAGKSVPLIAGRSGSTVEEGDVFAIETFASTGPGESRPDVNRVQIFRVVPIRRAIRSKAARQIKQIGLKAYHGLPCAYRWLEQRLDAGSLRMGMRELGREGLLQEYHTLIDQPGSFISQNEHTILISDHATPTTLW